MLADLQKNPDDMAGIRESPSFARSMPSRPENSLSVPPMSNNARWNVRLSDLTETPSFAASPVNPAITNIIEQRKDDVMSDDFGGDEFAFLDKTVAEPSFSTKETPLEYNNSDLLATIIDPIAKPTTVKDEPILSGKDWWSLVGKESLVGNSPQTSQGKFGYYL